MMLLRSWSALLLLGACALAGACASGGAGDVLEAIELREEGFAANERGDWQRAIEAYSRAIDLDPGLASDYTERAFANGNLGKLDAAIADLTEAIRLEPDSPVGPNQRALYYNEQGRWSEAVADLDRTIELRPGRPDQHNGRGLAHLELGNFELAIADAAVDGADAADGLDVGLDDGGVDHPRAPGHSARDLLEARDVPAGVRVLRQHDGIVAPLEGLRPRQVGGDAKEVLEHP